MHPKGDPSPPEVTVVFTRTPHPSVVCGLAAIPTGLEPATSAVTGRRSNQLSYGTNGFVKRAPHVSNAPFPAPKTGLLFSYNMGANWVP